MELIKLITAYQNGLMSKLEFYGKAHEFALQNKATPEEYDLIQEIIENI